MSIPLRTIRDRVRGKIRDNDPRRASLNSVAVDQSICDAYLALQARMPAPELYTASAFTIAGGAETFQLPSTVTGYTRNAGGAEYAGDVRIQLVSDGTYLTRRTTDEIDSLRNGNPSVMLGVPSDFCIWEESDQDVWGRCYPGAKVAQACNLWVTMAADDLRDYLGTATDDMDDVEVLFSRYGCTALVYKAAAELVAGMTAEDLRLRRLNPAVASLWLREAEVLLYQDTARIHDLEGVGRTQRWVS